jgi:uncharacterized membrane protein
MILILSTIFLILLIIVGKARGFKTFILFYTSFILIATYILLMKLGFNALAIAIIICLLVSLFTLFGFNGVNEKTKSSFISIMIILIFITILTFLVSKNANIGGFSSDSIESIGGFSYEIGYNMNYVMIGIYLVTSIGTIIDTSISISSALNEVHENNPKLKQKELFESGMNIGKDILATTINTLFFAMISFFIGYFLWHQSETLSLMLNYKSLIQEIIKLFICFIGSILIIPITSYVFSKRILK